MAVGEWKLRFADELREGSRVLLPEVFAGVDIEKIRAKAHDFLKKYEHHAEVQKLKWNKPLTTGIPTTNSQTSDNAYYV